MALYFFVMRTLRVKVLINEEEREERKKEKRGRKIR